MCHLGDVSWEMFLAFLVEFLNKLGFTTVGHFAAIPWVRKNLTVANNAFNTQQCWASTSDSSTDNINKI